ncbi:MAG: hypothetical protein WA632_12510 [Gallionella sp.]
MKKKQPPEQYAAKPKTAAVQSAGRSATHPAFAVAKALVGWMEKGGLPPSTVLLHGLHIARSKENDGNPADTYLPLLKMQGDDNKVISAMLDALARPQVDKVQVVAALLKSVWVNKSARSSRALSSGDVPRKPVKAGISPSPTRNAKAPAASKPVVIVKKKR